MSGEYTEVRKGRYSWEEGDARRSEMASYLTLRGWDTDDDPDDDLWWNKATGVMLPLEQAYLLARAEDPRRLSNLGAE